MGRNLHKLTFSALWLCLTCGCQGIAELHGPSDFQVHNLEMEPVQMKEGSVAVRFSATLSAGADVTGKRYFRYGLVGASESVEVPAAEDFSADIVVGEYVKEYTVKAFFESGDNIIESDSVQFALGDFKEYVSCSVPRILEAGPFGIYVESDVAAAEGISPEYGFRMSPAGENTVPADSIVCVPEGGVMTAYFSGLDPGREYVFQGFVRDRSDIFLSEPARQRTYDFGVVVDSIEDITFKSASVRCHVLNTDGRTILEEGVILNDTLEPTHTSKIPAESSGDTFIVRLSDLVPGCAYQLRAYVETSAGTEYGRSTVSFMTRETPPAVDLGLSVLWAPYNVGAESEKDSGWRLSWGETWPKSEYTMKNYSFFIERFYYTDRGYYSVFSKYTEDIPNYSGDGLSTLEPEDDAASVNWGCGWRMPTKAEMAELVEQCTWTSTSGGYVVTGKNGNSIFMHSDPEDGNYRGYYWSSSLRLYAKVPPALSSSKIAEVLIADVPGYMAANASYTGTPDVRVSGGNRENGLRVRPVCNRKQ